MALYAMAKVRAHRLAIIGEPAAAHGAAIVRGWPVDLIAYCNYRTTNSTLVPRNTNHVNNLAALPLGTTNYAGVRFKVGGLIQLASRESANWKPPHPAKVTGIPVTRKCRKIHILHGTGFWAPDGLPVAMLVVHYANGAERKLPIVYGQQVRDWWASKAESLERGAGSREQGGVGTEIAWVGENPLSKQMKAKLRLYRTTFENPLPDVELRSIDYVSTLTQAAPFLCGLSLE